jgi:RecA-family ATPase
MKAQSEETSTKIGDPILLLMDTVEPQEVKWLWKGRLPQGSLSLLVGRPGEGKSSATLDWASRISTGAPWPAGAPCERGDVLIISCEDNPGYTIRPRLDAHEADNTRIHMLMGVHGSNSKGKAVENMFTLADIAPLEKAIESIKNLKLIVIDPIGSYMGSDTDAHRDNEVRELLAPLAALAQEKEISIVLVAHQRKNIATNPDDMVMGSRAFTGLPRSILHLLRDPNDEKRRLLLPGKMNLCEPPPGLAFTIGGEPARLIWDSSPITMSAAEALAMSNTVKTRSNPAETWLLKTLSDGPMPANEVEELVGQESFSWRSTERAKKSLGIKSIRKGGSDGQYAWHLPS